MTDLKQQRAAERQRIDVDRTWNHMVSERETRRAADKRLQAACDDAVARRLADEQVTADEFGAKEVAPTVRIELDGFAAQVAWLDIPDSLLAYDVRIRNALRYASDTIKELA